MFSRRTGTSGVAVGEGSGVAVSPGSSVPAGSRGAAVTGVFSPPVSTSGGVDQIM